MDGSTVNPENTKPKKNKKLVILLTVVALVLLAAIAAACVYLVKKHNAALEQKNNLQSENLNDSVLDIAGRQETAGEDDGAETWEAVTSEMLYGFYLPQHCSSQKLANVDVVNNAFEQKSWSTYLSSKGEALTLSTLPLYWKGSELTLDLISEENLEQIRSEHGIGIAWAYEAMIRELYGNYDFVTLTYYDAAEKMYEVDCAYRVEGNSLSLSMISYDEKEQEYLIIPMEEYQVIRDKNEITLRKEKSFLELVPYNLCEEASAIVIEAFVEDESKAYEDIIGIAYYNYQPWEEKWTVKGHIYFADGSKAEDAIFDFSEEDMLTIRWANRETKVYGRTQIIKETGEVTFAYTMIQDTGLILEADGVEYRYLLDRETYENK